MRRIVHADPGAGDWSTEFRILDGRGEGPITPVQWQAILDEAAAPGADGKPARASVCNWIVLEQPQ